MSLFAIEMAKLEVNGTHVRLQPGSSQLFNEKEDFIMKYEIDQSSMKSSNFIVFHFILREMWMWLTIQHQMLCSTQTLDHQLHCIFFEDYSFISMKVEGDGSCLYWAIASHIMSCFFDDVWTERFPL